MRRLHVTRAELRMAKPDTEPLRHVDLEPHPLVPLQTALAKVDVAGGERADVIVDLLPLTPAERLKYRERQRTIESKDFMLKAKPASTRGKGFGEQLARALGAPPPPVLPPEVAWNEASKTFGKAEAEEVLHRVTTPYLYKIQILMRVASYDAARADARLEELLACWEQWAGRNWYELVLTNLRVGYFGSNVGPRRWWFDYRFRTGRFGPLTHTRSAVVGVKDIAGWITPPPPTVPVPPPPAEPSPPSASPHQPDPTPTEPMPPVGNVDDTEIVAVHDLVERDGSLLLYGMGRRGTAVDRLAAELVARATHAGAGAIVLEADTDQRSGIPAWGRAGHTDAPLLTADVTRPVAGWNPLLAATAGSPVDRAAVAVRALTVMAASSDASQAAALIDAAVSTLRTLVAFVPRELAPTLFQIGRLIDDPAWREAVLPVLDGPMRRFWTDVLPGIHRTVARTVTDLVRSLQDDPVAAASLGQPATTYDPYATLAAGKTVVLSGGVTPLNDALAMLLWLDATAAARTLVESGGDAAPLLVATAVHRRDSDHEGMVIDDFAATAQSGVQVVLLTDRPDLHSDEARRALRGLATAVAVDSVDAGADIAATWLGLDGAPDLLRTLDNLGLGECLVLTARDGWRPRPLIVRRHVGTDTAGDEQSSTDVPEGQTLQSTRARLDDLEERITEHLLSPPPPDPATTEPDGPEADTNVISFDPSRRRKGASQK